MNSGVDAQFREHAKKEQRGASLKRRPARRPKCKIIPPAHLRNASGIFACTITWEPPARVSRRSTRCAVCRSKRGGRRTHFGALRILPIPIAEEYECWPLARTVYMPNHPRRVATPRHLSSCFFYECLLRTSLRTKIIGGKAGLPGSLPRCQDQRKPPHAFGMCT